MRDILDALTKLTEAVVKPGERKDISFTLDKLDKIQTKLGEYERSLRTMQYATIPDSMQDDMRALQEKLSVEIEKVRTAYNNMYEKSIVNGRPVKMNNLFKALHKNCQQIIKVYQQLNGNSSSDQKRFMYRGIKSRADALYGKPFTARAPKDSNSELHHLLNNAMKDAGLDARRDNAMFVSGDVDQASGYGSDVYILFPVDGFTFTWSREIKDLVLSSDKKTDLIDRTIAKQIREIIEDAKSKNAEDVPIAYPSELFTYGYRLDSEIDTISALVKQGKLPKELDAMLDSLLTNESILAYFDFSDSDIYHAIMSKKEIYVKGDYYAVNRNHLSELMKFLREDDTSNVDLPENFGEVPVMMDRGTVVVITGGPNEGTIGTVTSEYPDNVEVSTAYGENALMVSKSLVKPYTDPASSKPLTTGDKVIVSNKNNSNFGTVGIIFSRLAPGIYRIEDDDANRITVLSHELAEYTPELEAELNKEIAKNPTPPKVGNQVVVSDPKSPYYGKKGKVTYAYSAEKLEVYLETGSYQDFYIKQLVQKKFASPDVLAGIKPEPGEIQVGDNVRILSGDYKDYNGSVLTVTDDSLLVNVLGIDVTIELSKDAVGKIDPDSDPGYEEGDRVKITKSGDVYYGRTGKIISGPDADYEYLVAIDGSPAQDYYAASELEKLDSDATPGEGDGIVSGIQIGDTVKIANSESSYHNTVGKVEAIEKLEYPSENGTHKVKITKDGGYPITTFLDWVEKVDDTSTEPEYKFAVEVGDTVKVKTDDATIANPGETGVVDSIFKKFGTVLVKFPGGKTATYLDTELEKVGGDKPNTALFKKGDLITVNADTASKYVGKQGVVTNVTGGIISVDISGGGKSAFFPEEISKANNPSVAQIDYSLGDTVRVTDPKRDDFGSIYKINYIYPSGALGLENESGQGGIVQSSQIQPYKTVSDEIDNLKWEPEPEVTPPAPKFAVGDTVEVTSQFPSLIGKKGKITHPGSEKFPDVVAVKLDGNPTHSSFPASALKKVSDDSAEIEEDLAIGDTVQVTKDTLSTYGKKGKIHSFGGSMMKVEFSDDPSDYAIIKKTSVKKIS